MSRFGTAVGVAGVAAVVATAALVFGVVSPDAVASLSAFVDGFDDSRYLLALAAVLLLGGAWFARRRGSSTVDRFTKLAEAPPESAAAPASIRVGGDFDRELADAASAPNDDAMRPVASRVRGTAVGLYADVADVDRETARRRVRAGTWTNDGLAAAFLAEEEAMPFRSRVRAWLDPSRERRRRVDAALDALFELRAGDVPDVDPSEQPPDRRSTATGAGERGSESGGTDAEGGDSGAESRGPGGESGVPDDEYEGSNEGSGEGDDAGRSWVSYVTDCGGER